MLWERRGDEEGRLAVSLIGVRDLEAGVSERRVVAATGRSGRRRVQDGLIVSLFWRVFLLNAALLVAAGVVLAVSPIQISTPTKVLEEAVLVLGVVLLLAVNYVLLRPAFAPLERLAERMRNVDLLRPGAPLTPTGSSEVVALVRSFNEMLASLEEERRESARLALAAQEGERKRIAVELHDEVGQTMTGVLLLLERVSAGVPGSQRAVFGEVQEAVRKSLEDVRRIAEELRPELLEHLGLVSALKSLSGTISGRAGLKLEWDFAQELPPLSADTELAVYRIAQEGLTNAARHAQARRVWVSLRPGERGLVLRVRDDGRGVDGRGAPGGGGVRGMFERAALIGATLTIEQAAEGGTEVRLEVPAAGSPP
jgi:two-component system, NarL family, sensor histidine kinase UhpB